MALTDPDSTPGCRSSSSSLSPGREMAGHVENRHLAAGRGHRGDGDVEFQLVEPVTGSVAQERDSVGQWVSVAVVDPVTTGEADDVGGLGGQGQQPVPVARDEDRDVGRMLAQVLGGVAQIVDAFACAGEGQFRGVELFAHVARAEPEVEPAAGQIPQGGGIARQQRRFVEAGIEHERPDAQRAGRRGDGGQGRERGGRAEMVRHVEHVEAEVFGTPGGVGNLRLGFGGSQADAKAEIVGHHPILGRAAAGLEASAVGNSEP